jgi:hypothetical protein
LAPQDCQGANNQGEQDAKSHTNRGHLLVRRACILNAYIMRVNPSQNGVSKHDNQRYASQRANDYHLPACWKVMAAMGQESKTSHEAQEGQAIGVGAAISVEYSR